MNGVQLIERARRIASVTGECRYVVYTSLGWRIERAPSGPSNLIITVYPNGDTIQGIHALACDGKLDNSED